MIGLTLDCQDCSRSLVVSYIRELLKNFSRRQVTCLVEGPSPLGDLLVLEIRSGAISLGKFQNIPSSTGYPFTLVLPAPVGLAESMITLPIKHHGGLAKPFSGSQYCWNAFTTYSRGLVSS